MTNRLDELRANLESLESEIQQAAAASNAKQDIQLVAVSKTWPTSDVRFLYELGQRHFGENKSQDAVIKAGELQDLSEIVWHHIGQVQTNKAAQIVSYAEFVHSIDRMRAAEAINKAAANQNKTIKVFIQVSLDDEPSAERGGVNPTELNELAIEVSGLSSLILVGLMAVAPVEASAEVAFARFDEIAHEFAHNFPDATLRSIGMSGDFSQAIAAGATHLRIGSTLFGNRSYQ